MSEEINQLAYDSVTGVIDVSCNLVGNGQIPGWNINLQGWHLSDMTLSAIWAKVRKLLRLHGVDAVALFKFEDSGREDPFEMSIIPETSILGNHNIEFADYAAKLAKILSQKALSQFAAFMVEAQTLSQNGKSTEEIVAVLFPPGFEKSLINISDLTVTERIALRRKIRKAAKRDYKDAAKIAREAITVAERYQAQAEQSVNAAQEANDKDYEALARTAKKDLELAQTMTAHAEEAKRKEWQARTRYEHVCRIFHLNRPSDGPVIEFTEFELSELLSEDSAQRQR